MNGKHLTDFTNDWIRTINLPMILCNELQQTVCYPEYLYVEDH